jgi:hypothetical protein
VTAMPEHRGMSGEFEAVLRRALAPVDPPAELEQRLEMTLGSLVELAADELESWELSAMKDPRNWGRAVPAAAAVVVGSGAAVGLIVLRTQRRRHKRRAAARGAWDLAARTVSDAAREAMHVFDDIAPNR